MAAPFFSGDRGMTGQQASGMVRPCDGWPRASRVSRHAAIRRAVSLTLGVAGGGGWAWGGVGRGGASPGSRAELRHAIDSMVASPAFSNAHWGILIVDPERGDTIYSRNAGKLFMPASNQKIVTGAVALTLLGPDYQFSTTFAARGPIEGGVLRGDLVVIGRGDPSMSNRMRGDVMQALRVVPDSLRAHDVRYVSGRLQRGGDAFPDAWHGFGWGWDDFDFAYSAGVDELLFNEDRKSTRLNYSHLVSSYAVF